MSNRKALVGIILLLGLLAPAAVPARAGEKFKLPKTVDLGVDARSVARLSPDGKQVLYVKKLEDGKTYAYFAIGADGKNDRQVFASTVGWDDPFTFCFGKGLISPDGKSFAALTTSDGKGIRQEGAAVMRICSFDGKAKPKDLPSKAGRHVGALFAADGSIVFADGFPLSPKNREEPWSVALRKVSVDGKAADVVKIAGSLLISVAMNPKRNRVAGILVNKPSPESRAMPGMQIWVCDLASGRVDKSGNLRLDDYFRDGGPVVFWSLDGRHVYTNGNAGSGENGRKYPFSVLRFEPFRKLPEATAEETAKFEKLVARMGSDNFETREKATAALRSAGEKALPVLRKAAGSTDVEIRSRAEGLVTQLSGKVETIAAGKSLVVAGEVSPGKLSAADVRAKKGYVLDAATGKITECAEPLLLVDRSGSTGLFAHLVTRKLHVGKLEAKP